MSTLYAGKFLGEFGHELFAWQGYLRAMSRNYDRTFVECRKGHEALYEDFATIGTPEGMSEGAAMRDVDIVRTPEDADRSTWPIVYRPGREPSEVFKAQEFVQYGGEWEREGVVFHARKRAHRDGDNWGSLRWAEIGARYPHAQCIGTMSGSLSPRPCNGDLRGRHTWRTVRALRSPLQGRGHQLWAHAPGRAVRHSTSGMGWRP